MLTAGSGDPSGKQLIFGPCRIELFLDEEGLLISGLLSIWKASIPVVRHRDENTLNAELRCVQADNRIMNQFRN